MLRFFFMEATGWNDFQWRSWTLRAMFDRVTGVNRFSFSRTVSSSLKTCFDELLLFFFVKRCSTLSAEVEWFAFLGLNRKDCDLKWLLTISFFILVKIRLRASFPKNCLVKNGWELSPSIFFSNFQITLLSRFFASVHCILTAFLMFPQWFNINIVASSPSTCSIVFL